MREHATHTGGASSYMFKSVAKPFIQIPLPNSFEKHISVGKPSLHDIAKTDFLGNSCHVMTNRTVARNTQGTLEPDSVL